MNCTKCNSLIPSKRASLGFRTCVDCSDVEGYGFVNIINHKTGNTIQPLPKEQAAAINKIGDRKRFGTILKGGSKSTTYNPKNLKHGCSITFVGSETSFNEVGEAAVKMLDTKGFEAASLYIERQAQNLFISGSQCFKLKQIISALK